MYFYGQYGSRNMYDNDHINKRLFERFSSEHFPAFYLRVSHNRDMTVENEFILILVLIEQLDAHGREKNCAVLDFFRPTYISYVSW